MHRGRATQSFSVNVVMNQHLKNDGFKHQIDVLRTYLKGNYQISLRKSKSFYSPTPSPRNHEYIFRKVTCGLHVGAALVAARSGRGQAPPLHYFACSPRIADHRLFLIAFICYTCLV